MFYIRTDANQEIATGHLMRCMAIAKGMRKKNIECTFITADLYAKQLIQDNGFKLICLDSTWNNLDLEIDKLIYIIKLHKIKHLLIDTYFVTQKYLKTIKKNTKTIYIDDINKFVYPVDILINYNNYYEIFQYEKNYINNNTKFLLGCNYAPLREDFSGINYTVRKNISKILITTGGTDNYNITGKFLDYITSNNLYENVEFHIVVGKFNKHKGYLDELIIRNKNIFLFQNVTTMSELMTKSDLAISAGGSTLYELCACGVPTICLSFADNQINGVHGFAEKKIMLYAGDIRNGEEKCIEKITESIDLYINYINRSEISKKMQLLVDGKGVNRIIKNLS